MRRLEIMIDEDLDEALGRQARSEKTSKAALIRRFLRERVTEFPSIEDDPLWELVGMAGDAEPVEDIDDYLLRPKRGRDLR